MIRATSTRVSASQGQHKAALSSPEQRDKGTQHEVSQKKASASSTSNKSIVSHSAHETTGCEDVKNLAEDVDRIMASIDNIRQSSGNTAQLCPYHEHHVSQMGLQLTGLDPMDRFLVQNVSEQGSICYVPREGTLSITKPCTCGENIWVDMSTNKAEGDVGVTQRNGPEWDYLDIALA